MTRHRLRFIAAVILFATIASACVLPSGLRGGSGNSIHVVPGHETGPLAHDEWHYLEFEETACANGTPVGLGVNPGTNSEELVLYLNGGGACWDAPSCNLFRTAANLDVTYDADRLGEELAPFVEAGLLDRSSELNPWPKANFVFIPYCTGDLHTGTTVTHYDSFGGDKPIHHVGAENFEVYLRVIRHAFPDLKRIWLIGVSAGGYGATWHFQRLQKNFPQAEIHVYSDASPWLPLEPELWAQWRENWAMQMPEDCPRCIEAPDHLISELLRANPTTRFALSAHERDATLAAFVGVLPREFEEDLHWFLQHRFHGPNTRSFIARGSEHETLPRLHEGLICREGQDLARFLWGWARPEALIPLPPALRRESAAP